MYKALLERFENWKKTPSFHNETEFQMKQLDSSIHTKYGPIRINDTELLKDLIEGRKKLTVSVR